MIGRRLRSDAGMVTAELAMALPALVLLSMTGVVAVGVGQARVRCADAAGEAARAVARGDAASAAGRARAVAGAAVALTIASSADDSRVTARLTLRPVSWLPSMAVVETAVVATEPGVVP